MQRVDEIMSRPVITCRPTDSLNAAAGLMWENDCGVLPVVNAHGALVGIITDRDICMGAYTTGKDMKSVPVQHAMAKMLVTLLPSDTIDVAERRMAKAQVHRLPVIDGHGRPIGIVSLNDIARATANDEPAAADALATLAAVCAPRNRALSQAPTA